MGISASDLAGMQATINAFDPNMCTLVRTGGRYNVRVRDNGRDLRPFKNHRWFLSREWRLLLQDAVPIVPGDQIAVDGMNTYLVLSVTNPTSMSLDTTVFAITLGTPIAGSTKREPVSLAVGQTGGYATHIASLTCYQFASNLLQSVSPTYMKDAFNATVQQPAVVYCAAPTGLSEPFPISMNDVLVLPGGSYTVYGVEPWVPGYLAVYVEVPIA